MAEASTKSHLGELTKDWSRDQLLEALVYERVRAQEAHRRAQAVEGDILRKEAAKAGERAEAYWSRRQNRLWNQFFDEKRSRVAAERSLARRKILTKDNLAMAAVVLFALGSIVGTGVVGFLLGKS